jgi:hypothetical protein
VGVGDWILASGEAEKCPEGKKVVFGNGTKAWHHEVFEGNPKITKHASQADYWIPNYPGSRPYIKKVIPYTQYFFDENYRAPYGKIYLTDQEREWAKKVCPSEFVIVEPNVKDEGNGGILCLGRNKAWNKWDELLKMDVPWLQIGTRKPKVGQVKTETFRKALAVLERAKLVVTTDGALHHAAAALGVPAVVLWGGFVSPKILGYPTHTNIWSGAEPCGWFKTDCEHCKKAMDSITVDQVRRAIEMY